MGDSQLSNTLTAQIQAHKKYDLSIVAQWKSSMKQDQPYLLRRNPPMTDLLAPTSTPLHCDELSSWHHTVLRCRFPNRLIHNKTSKICPVFSGLVL